MKTKKSGLTLRERAANNGISILLHLILTIVALFVLYPVVYVVCAAFTPGDSVSAMPVIPLSTGVTTDHFTYLIEDTDYLKWFKNTLIIATATCLSTVVVCALAGYTFARFRFTFKKPLLLSFLILQVFPSFVGMIAIYVILWRMGGLDTLWGLVLVYVAGNTPYNIWLVKNYVDALPRSIDEAAKMDGASNAGVFFRIVLPLIRPILTFLTITSFAGPWMDFIFPKMVLRSSENQTLALGLYAFVTDKKAQYTSFAAGAILVAIPFMIFFMLSQKTMINSLSAAAVKE